MDIDFAEVEQELCRIPEITAARIVTEGGRPVEVHILASASKHAKQVVRDVQSVAIATFGLELDRRMISVVQLDAADGKSEAEMAPNRIAVDGVTVSRSATRGKAEVILRQGDQKFVGSYEGSAATSITLRLVALATLDALRQIEPAAEHADVEAATCVHLADRTVAVTSIVFVITPDEEVISGSAVVRTAGEHDAIARAVLDATNRRLAQLH